MSNYTHIYAEPLRYQAYNVQQIPFRGYYYNGTYYTVAFRYTPVGGQNNVLIIVPDLTTKSGVMVDFPEGEYFGLDPGIVCIDNYVVIAYSGVQGMVRASLKILYYDLSTETWSDVIDTGVSVYDHSLSNEQYVGTLTSHESRVGITVKDGRVIIGCCTKADTYEYTFVSYYPNTELEYTTTALTGNGALHCFDIGCYNDTIYLFCTHVESVPPGFWRNYGRVYNSETGEYFNLEVPGEGTPTEEYSISSLGSSKYYACIYEDGIRFMYLYVYKTVENKDRCKLIYGYFDGTSYTCRTLLDWGYGIPEGLDTYPAICYAYNAIGGLIPQFESKRYMLGIFNIIIDQDDYYDHIAKTYIDDYMRYQHAIFRYDFQLDWLFIYRLEATGATALKNRGSNILTYNEEEEVVTYLPPIRANYSSRDPEVRRLILASHTFHLDTARVFYKGLLRRTVPYVKIGDEMKKVNILLGRTGASSSYYRWLTYR